MSDDPTRLRNQPALTTASGNSWLISGALFVIISVAMLIALSKLPPPGLAWIAIILIVTLYAMMLVVRFLVQKRRTRLRFFAACLLAIALISLSSVITIATVNWAPL